MLNLSLSPALGSSGLHSSVEGGPVIAVLVMILALALGLGSGRAARAESPASPAHVPDVVVQAAIDALVEQHGDAEAERIRRGVAQVRDFWRPGEDGDAEAFRAFVEAEFVPQGEQLDEVFQRFEFALERIDGYFNSMGRDLSLQADLDRGPLLSLDHRLAAYSPGAHVLDDMFQNQIAFVALLNFPLSSLDQRLEEGMDWSRRQWAEARLAQYFSSRVPASVSQRISQTMSNADSYINAYNIYLHHLLTDDGRRPFPPGLRLISHWGLRDELKARYADPEGLEKQRMIKVVFDRIVSQEIPASVIDNPRLDWNPVSNEVHVSDVQDVEVPASKTAEASTTREPDTRYQHWLNIFQAVRQADPYYPGDMTFIDRRFERGREIPEAEVKELFETLLAAPVGKQVAELVSQRLGRPLEPFDIWYTGFKPGGGYPEEQLDEVTEARYPSVDAYAKDMPRLLQDLGFTEEKAQFLADNIVVQRSRGAGHALGASRRDDKAYLRTRVAGEGMNYKGFNIAVHEMGHTVEQVFSITTIDHTLLEGVPNTAFTEALAFVFQDRDLELLGLTEPDASAEHFAALDNFWNSREIMGVALVDMAAWNWLYAHPEATASEFRDAVLSIARDVWNRYYADIFGSRDETLLAVYSHMVDGAMYTPDYPLGHVIAFQIESYFRSSDKPLGVEYERLCKLGQITPDAWLRQGLGAPLSVQPLLEASAAAVQALSSGEVMAAAGN